MTTDADQDVNEWRLREEIVSFGRLMYDKGYVCGYEGNLSARLDAERLLITPSGLHKGLLEPEQMLVVDLGGRVIGTPTSAGQGLRPTSELPLHLTVYQQRPDVQAVLHAHPPITVALSIAGIQMDCLLPEVMVLLGIVPVTEYAMSSSHESADAVRDLIRDHEALVLQRHGTVTVGNSLMEAFMRLETVEQQARVSYLLAQLGVDRPLPPAEVRKLLLMRRAMGLERPGDASLFRERCGVEL